MKRCPPFASFRMGDHASYQVLVAPHVLRPDALRRCPFHAVDCGLERHQAHFPWRAGLQCLNVADVFTHCRAHQLYVVKAMPKFQRTREQLPTQLT